MAALAPPFSSPDDASKKLDSADYLADRGVAVTAYLAGALGKPLLLEGPAGVGKTELAKAVARCSGRELIRLQCYEGLDEAKAIYEWEYGKQLLYTQLLRDVVATETEKAADLGDAIERIARHETAFFHERFLLARPLLAAIDRDDPAVLLIDEVDRGDPELEAMLLEILSDFQITIPELGTRKARHVPYVVLTSNATREMTDALRRRCLHLFLDYPEPKRELAIVRRHVPEAREALVAQIVGVAQAVRKLDLERTPSVSEVVDWARALVLLGAEDLDAELVEQTLGVLSKHRKDAGPIRDAAKAALEG